MIVSADRLWRRSGDFGREQPAQRRRFPITIRRRSGSRENPSANSEARPNTSSCRRKTFGKRSAAADEIFC